MKKIHSTPRRARSLSNTRSLVDFLESRWMLDNTAPSAMDDSYSIAVNDVLTVNAPGVLSNDTDAEADPLTASLVANVAHGALTLNPDGSFVYTPTGDYHGTDTFSYIANDGALDSKTATVTIHINSAPTAANDAWTINEDQTLTKDAASGLLANDSDLNGDKMTAVKVTDPAHGVLTFNSDGSFTYVPTANYHGSDSFTYKVNDGSADSDPATVTFTIDSVNDAPVAVVNTYTVDEDATLTKNAADGVLTNDTDADSDTLTAVLVDNVAHGALTLNSNGSFTYTPTANYHGTDTFTYKAYDGTEYSAIVAVTLTVNSVDDAGKGEADAYTTAEDTTLTVLAPQGVLINDSDIDNETLVATVVDSPTHGLLTLNNNGSFTYIPAANYTGADSFTYKVNNSAAVTVSLTITAANDAPVGTNRTVYRSPGAPVLFSLSGMFTDAENDVLGFIVKTQAANGMAYIHNNATPKNPADDYLVYIPNPGYYLNDSVVVRASDNSAFGDATLSIFSMNVGLSPNPSTPSKNDLIVVGTNGKDAISLTLSGTKVKVTLNGVNKGLFNPTGKIIVKGLAGNDVIDASKLNRSVLIYGGDGNDVIKGSAKVCLLSGGAGKDKITSNNAKDIILSAENYTLLD